MQSLSEYTKLAIVNDMLRSFDLENNNENLEDLEDGPYDYFLQSTALLPSYEKHLSYNTAGNTMPTCVWQRYDPQYCLQSKLGLNTKVNRRLSIIPIKKKIRVEFLMNVKLETKCY
jgi:hypothetical protein